MGAVRSPDGAGRVSTAGRPADRRAVERRPRPPGTPLAEADDGELRMQELADLIGLNQSSVSRPASRLESSGLTAAICAPMTGAGCTA